MMKTMAFWAMGLLLSLSSCMNYSGTFSTGKDANGDVRNITASGNRKTRTERPGKFDRLFLDVVGEAVCISGNEYKVSVTGPENVVGLYEFSVVDGELEVRMKKGYQIKDMKKGCLIEITAPLLSGVTNEGVASVTVRDMASGERFALSNKGVGSVAVSNLTAKSVFIENDGVGSIDVSGEAESAEISNSGVGSVEAGGLHCKTVKASNDGVGSIDCFASERAEYTKKGVGSVDVSGGGVVVKK